MNVSLALYVHVVSPLTLTGLGEWHSRLLSVCGSVTINAWPLNVLSVLPFYWALIWLYADTSLNLATCPCLIYYIKWHSSSKKTQTSVSQRFLLRWSPTNRLCCIRECGLIFPLLFDFKLQFKNICQLLEGQQRIISKLLSLMSSVDAELMETWVLTAFSHVLKCDWAESCQHCRTSCYINQASSAGMWQYGRHCTIWITGLLCLIPQCFGPIMKM